MSQWFEPICSCMRVPDFENWCAGKGGANAYRVGSLCSYRVHSSFYGRGWWGCFQWQCRGLGWAFWSSLLIMCILLQDLSVALTASAHGEDQILKQSARFRICKFNAWWAFWAIIFLCGSGSIGEGADCPSCTASTMALPLFPKFFAPSNCSHKLVMWFMLQGPPTDPSVTTFSVADRSNPTIHAFYAYTLMVTQQRGTLRIFRLFALSSCDHTLVVAKLK